MLLTITYTGEKTQELGYLLHKNPYRTQEFSLNFGRAYVFYPKCSDTETTAALLLDINSIDLARGKTGAGGLFDYVNDRPYVASSFMSNAIARIFGTAMTGRCDQRPGLAEKPLELTACVYMLPCRGELGLINEVLEPLGYTVTYEQRLLDERFPSWGKSDYVNLTMHGKVKLCDLLNHLYVLIPVFDRKKHYYMAEDEIEKLISHGEGWLAAHPARDKIVSRYFARRRSYAGMALGRLASDEVSGETPPEDAPAGAPVGAPETALPAQRELSLNAKRLEAVKNAVLACGAKSVLDLGCGEGKLTAMLLPQAQLQKLGAADISVAALERLKDHVHYDRLSPLLSGKLTLMQASATYRDERFSGYDAICLVEVIEHIDPMRIPAAERVVFELSGARTVILTTPNREYNALYPWLKKDFRHEDHRFEWTREEFCQWTEHICQTFGYDAELQPIGDYDERFGAPTQMCIFTKSCPEKEKIS